MNIFVAGASGVIGRRLVPLLVAAGHHVIGTTRSPAKAAAIAAQGAAPVLIDAFNADALRHVVMAAKPQIIVHQLTDLPSAPGTPGYEAGLDRNARLRIDGTRNLVAAAKAAGVKRLIAQSIAFVYAPSDGLRVESDPLDLAATGARRRTVEGVAALENATLEMPDGIVLRYGLLYGPDTWFERDKRGVPGLHIDVAAHAALLALNKAKRGIYNVAEDDGAVSSEKAKRDFGFDAGFRITS